MRESPSVVHQPAVTAARSPCAARRDSNVLPVKQQQLAVSVPVSHTVGSGRPANS